MAVLAVLRRPDAARGVREMRIESLAAVAFPGNGLLLRIDPLAIGILRADHDRARGTDHRHAILFHRTIEPEHENVVPHDLRIVGGVISIGHAFEFILRYPLIRFHRQVTAETTRCPRGVTDLTIHRAIVVRETLATIFRRSRNRSPRDPIARQGLRIGRLRVVVRGERIDRVDRLRNFPAHIRRHG